MDENPYASEFNETTRVGGRRISLLRVCVCCVAGVTVTPFLLLISAYSSGGGHGDYIAARVAFPIPMLLTRYSGGSISLPIIVIAIAQYPTIGCVMGFASTRGRHCLVWTATVLVVVHVIAALLTFSGVIPNFSQRVSDLECI